MQHALQTPQRVEYRNFNLCPHCELLGRDPLLVRMSEGTPMISRSDGKSFHIVLADRPLPYPAERQSARTSNLSLYFWYCSGDRKDAVRSSLVLVPAEMSREGKIYPEIEYVADLLSEKLLQRRELAVLYNFQGNFLHELSY